MYENCFYMAKITYTPLNLPEQLVEELKLWKQAYSIAYMRPVSYAEMIRRMLDNLHTTDPGVVEEMDGMIRRHPELGKKLHAWTAAEEK